MYELVEYFIEDLKDQIINLNESILEIESKNNNDDTIKNLFRVALTIRGNSQTLGFEQIEIVMSSMEKVIKTIRNGKQEINSDILEILYTCNDFLEECNTKLENDHNDYGIDIGLLVSMLPVWEEYLQH